MSLPRNALGISLDHSTVVDVFRFGKVGRYREVAVDNRLNYNMVDHFPFYEFPGSKEKCVFRSSYLNPSTPLYNYYREGN